MNLDHFLFEIYPYMAMSIFVLGSWLRYDRESYSWKTDSSQLLAQEHMLWGSNLFHVGVIAIFFGHALGLLTPHSWLLAGGISDLAHQIVAITAGLLFGLLALAGGGLLLWRRLTNRRVRATGRSRDLFILGWLLATLSLGLLTIPVSMGHAAHGNVQAMLSLAAWVQSVVTLQADATLLARVEPIFKWHLFFGMTVFLLFPFTRLVHVLSVPIGYLGRAWQISRAYRSSHTPRG
ncbi:MAG: respiratory nitrate reductase subunit gamma [Magnetococcus sp. MYC-9]